MGIKKTASLKTAFWKFLCMLLLGLTGAVALPYFLLSICTNMGIISYANYSEYSVKNLVPIISAAPDFADISLPAGCRYLRLDQNYQIIETTLDGDDLEHAMSYAMSGKSNGNQKKQYLLITRKNESVVLQYYIGSQFTNEWCYQHLPSPELLLVLLIGINCLTVCMKLTAGFAAYLQKQLSPIFEATEQISQQNLDFEVGHSKMKEFEDVLCSFSDMKNHLKESLEQQWKAEQSQKEQIAALAHDLKTPLTVIQGNIDLISETALDEEQQLYAGYITESSEQIGTYIRTLIDISRASAGYQLHLEKLNVSDYMNQMKQQCTALSSAANIHIHMETASDLGDIYADKMLLERAILNVFHNALDYSPTDGTVSITVQKADCFLQISIADEGCGFTPELLLHAREQFFMGDRSRTSHLHFGMGLYIVNTIVKQHNGELLLKNHSITNGAQVILKIPYEREHPQEIV